MTLYKNRDKIRVLAKAKIKKGGKKYNPILQPNILAVLIRKLANNAYIERTRDGERKAGRTAWGQRTEIGRAHVWAPVTDVSSMPSSAWKKFF